MTLAELQGAVVNLSLVYQEKIIRNGEVRYPQMQTAGQITFGPNNTLNLHFQATSAGKTRTNSGTKTIGKPGNDAEGNDTVWVFSGGNLTQLRVFGGAGGQMMHISFRRGANGLGCSVSRPMARETGVGRIQKGSSVDGVPIEILEFKLVSSSCQVTKGPG